MKIERILITPDIAKEMLTHNIGNRPLNKYTVDYYVSIMQRGEWKENGDTIRFNKSGHLSDGQHRLEAIVKSGVPCWYIVVSEVDDIAFSTMDCGRRREAGDTFAVLGVHSSRNMAAIVRFVLTMEKGKSTTLGSKRSGLTNSDFIVEYERNKTVYENSAKLAARYWKKLNFLSVKEIGGIYSYLVIYRQHTEDEVKAFFDELFYGHTHNGTCLLRDRLIKSRIGNNNRLVYGYKIQLIAKAWNLFYAQRDTKVLKVSEAENVTFN